MGENNAKVMMRREAVMILSLLATESSFKAYELVEA